jgi:MOSC domain-containing protein YiiM
MFRGILESIYIASDAEGPMQSVPSALAIPGAGLDGDRYALKTGTFYKPKPDFELTLIEAEAIEAMARDYAIELAAGDARRNLVTRGVPLNHLVGREFSVGGVRIRGIRLCEPCEHLQRITGKSVIKGLLHRGGLRAQVLTKGTIHAGDEVRESTAEPNEASADDPVAQPQVAHR